MIIIYTYLKDMDDLEILSTYNAEIRGLYEYYKLARNVSVLQKFKHIMEYSMYKTFANKYKSSVSKIISKYSIYGEFGVRYYTKTGERIRLLYNRGFQNKDGNSAADIAVDFLPNTAMYSGRTSILDRLRANKCELCGIENVPMEMHHVRKLKDLVGKKRWEAHMIARKRKTLALCVACHKDLHAGKLL